MNESKLVLTNPFSWIKYEFKSLKHESIYNHITILNMYQKYEKFL